MGFNLPVHHISGESRIERNANGEVATTVALMQIFKQY